MDRSVHREIRIGDDFEAARSGVLQLGWTGKSDPGAFHLGKAAKFGNAAEGEGQRGVLCREGRRGYALQGEIEKDFVGDDGEIVSCAERGELGLFV